MKKLFLLILCGLVVFAACRQGASTPTGIPPIITSDLSGEILEPQQFNPLKLSVSAKSPTERGSISYEWFKIDNRENISWIAERSSGEMQVNTDQLGHVEVFCRVYHKEPGRTTVYRDSIHQKITVIENTSGITNDPRLTPYIENIASISTWKGSGFFLKATASAQTAGTLSYQWYEVDNPQRANPQPVSGADAAVFQASKTIPKTYYYYCRVKNASASGAAIAVSNVVSVEVKRAAPTKAETPQISVKNGSCTISAHEKVPLSVAATVTDGGVLSYQWYTTTENTATGGTVIGESDNGTKETISVQPSATTKYYCKVTNTLKIDDATAYTGVGCSELITLTVSSSSSSTQPEITYPAADMEQNIRTGTVFWLKVEAHSVDNGVLSYQWYWNDTKETTNGRKIAGATAVTYPAKLDEAKTIYYYCEVTNTKNNTTAKKTSPVYCYTTHTEKLLAQQPRITKNVPTDKKVLLKDESVSVSISAESPDDGYLTYQWYKSSTKNDVDAEYIPGATQPSLQIHGEVAGTLYYRCLVTNTNPAAKEKHTQARMYSNWYEVEVKEIKDLSQVEVREEGEMSATVQKGSSATFTVKVMYQPEGASITYQWKTGEPPTGTSNSPANSNAEGTSNQAAYTTSTTLTTNSSPSTYTYYCAVTVTKEGLGSKTVCSKKFTLTVVDILPKTPVISHQPTGGHNNKASGVSLTVQATVEGGTAQYQWYKCIDSSKTCAKKIDTATQATYKATEEGSFYYYCEVANSNNTNLKVSTTPVWASVYYDDTFKPVDLNNDAAGFGWDTQDFELGSKKSSNEITFAVYSEHAELVMLEIYDQPQGASATVKAAFFMEKNSSDNIWRAKIQTIATASKVYYGFRTWGPNWTLDPAWKRGSNTGFKSDVDEAGNRFNPNKLLTDPYSLELSHTIASGVTTAYQSGSSYRTTDSGRDAPKSVVVEKLTNSDITQKSTDSKLNGEVIYQLHVKGFTGNGVSNIEGCTVPDQEKGTYAGAAQMIKYLQGLGINTVLLMPVFESAGYNDYAPANFFAVAKKYAKDKEKAAQEFQEMVKKFHEANIQVFLDVPYTNTSEDGTNDDKTEARLESLRGLDNSAYYALTDGNKKDYWCSTGKGNNINCTSEPAKKLILDSLKYWTETMGIDGFRFNAGVALGRTGTNWDFSQEAPLLQSIKEYLTSKKCKCIIETKDSKGTGTFADGWIAWNNDFRDGARHYLNYKEPAVKVTNMLNKAGGVNFMAAHDSYRLTDMVSHGGNAGEVSTDSKDNGDISSTSVEELRRIRVRNALVLTAFSKGSPLLTYGDEFGASQGTTTTVYTTNDDKGVFFNDYDYLNRDNICTELGSDCHNDSKNGLYLFAKTLFLWRSENAAFFKDAQYTVTKEKGETLGTEDKCCRVLVKTSNAAYCVCINMWKENVKFNLPKTENEKWACCIDTAKWAEHQDSKAEDNLYNDRTTEYQQTDYGVGGYSVAVFKKIP